MTGHPTRSGVLDVLVIGAGQVVVATGPLHVPFVPPIAKDLDPDVIQIRRRQNRQAVRLNDTILEGT